MNQAPLYPLRFEPAFQYRLWGGQHLAGLLDAPSLPQGPVGEAWLLSDRDEQSSVVADGALKGRTLRQLLVDAPQKMLGRRAERFYRFPLLLKFLDVRGSLSVQVHPSDRQSAYLPVGESGKTEAWVVLEAGPESLVYAGLAPNATRDAMLAAIDRGTVAQQLASFIPCAGDGIFIPAGAVHSLRDLVVFEVQENSDVTFRLFDWGHLDAKTHQTRPLQVEQAMACIDFSQGAIGPVLPTVETIGPEFRERLFDCEHFRLWRIRSDAEFDVGAVGNARIVVCIDGEGGIQHERTEYRCRKGDVLLLPADIGVCTCIPRGAMTLLEIALPSAD